MNRGTPRPLHALEQRGLDATGKEGLPGPGRESALGAAPFLTVRIPTGLALERVRFCRAIAWRRERERARESERFKRVQESIAMQRLVICSSRISYMGGACAHFAKRAVPRVVNLVRSQHGVGRTAYAVGQGHCTWALSCVGHCDTRPVIIVAYIDSALGSRCWCASRSPCTRAVADRIIRSIENS